jgi:hypothetical protein
MVVLALVGVVPAVPALAANPGGAVVAWGYNISGQATVPAGLSGVTAVAAGGWHSLAVVSPALVGERDKPWEATRPGALDRLCG